MRSMTSVKQHTVLFKQSISGYEVGARWHHIIWRMMGGHSANKWLSCYLVAFVCITVEQAERATGGGEGSRHGSRRRMKMALKLGF